jgi:D-alanyl-lipoteichoic acid acyltransferase DltB (MBOAT superfamily)
MACRRSNQKLYFTSNPELSPEDKKAYRARVNAKQKKIFIFCLMINLGILAVLKYANFAILNANAIISAAGGRQLPLVNFLLPLGISFYTFQSIGYLTDVYRGADDEPNIFKFALFVSFFPQLIQGPISRFEHLKQTLFTRRSFNIVDFQAGLLRILWGFFKKLLVADRLFAAVIALAASPDDYRGVYVILTMLFYMVTLYADFSGGIDITIGIARMLGIKLHENFNRPFYSPSVTEYWRRWHITLGAWFKDYLFYPVSSSKIMLMLFKKTKKKFGDGTAKRMQLYIPTLLIWFATGLWHGAQWYFIIWGLMHGTAIIISEELRPLGTKFHKRFAVDKLWWYKAFQIIRTFCFISAVSVLYAYADVKLTFKMYASLITDFGWSRFIERGLHGLGLAWADYLVIIAAVLIMIAAGVLVYDKKIELKNLCPAVRSILIAALFFAVIIFGAYGFGYDSQQFIYNQF